RDDRQLESEGGELPGDVDVTGVARSPAGNDRDVVEAVGPPTGLADADLDFHLSSPLSALRAGPLGPRLAARRDARLAVARLWPPPQRKEPIARDPPPRAG